MEWIIMNCDGLKGLCSELGVFTQGSYQAFHDCYETLMTILGQLEDDDPVERNTRQQLAAAHFVQQDLVPMLSDLEDDPDVFQLGIRLLVSLTQPVECLRQGHCGGQKGQGETEVPAWVWDVNSMLIEAKTVCSNTKFIKAVFTEIERIFEDAGEYDLTESDCESINQCLLVIQNLLYIQDTPGHDCLTGIHVVFLRNLFQCRIDKILLFLLNSKQKDFWGVTLVQLISLLYRDLVSEIFVRIEDMSSCGEESCDSSNCSHCEAAMDRPFPFDPTFHNSASKTDSSDSSGKSSPDYTRNTVSSSADSKTMILLDQQGSESPTSSPLSLCFRNSCQIDQESDQLCTHVDSTDSCSKCQNNQNVKEDFTNSSECLSSSTIKSSTVKSKLASASSEMKSSDSNSSLDDLGSQLTDFTFNFLQNGFSSLVNVLKQSLMQTSNDSPQALDDSYFLWSVAFFLKFARRKEIEFKKIKDVFTADVFGFIVCEAVSNGEDVINSFKNKKPYNLSMRRLHLSVSALRELIKTLTFHRERGLEESELQYLEQLQKNLANMADLRQVFLWLIRNYQPGCHSILFLRDVIVTNHYFLLLLEEWIGRDFCQDKRINMLGHVKQFAVTGVMQKYGYLLQNFVRNDHHVNNCLFTMMHHVAGDCLRPEALLQVDIIKTFLQIWDTEIPITQEMNDLMEYVIQKFLSTAEENPVSCAFQLFIDTTDLQEDMFTDSLESVISESEWTDEEMDRVFVWYSELEGCSNIVERMTIMFGEIGVKKSKLEIVNYMVKMGWLNSDQLRMFMGSERQVVKSVKQSVEEKQNKCISVLEELSSMDEDKVISHCIDKLKDEGLEEQIQYLQSCLLEAAYIKIDGEYTEKQYLEEPVYRYYLAKGKDFPVIYYNDEQEKMANNVYMLALQQQMGLRLEDETQLIYPRIPHDLSVSELVEKAQLLGKLDQDYLKFDLSSVHDQISATTKDIFTTAKHIYQPERKKSPSQKMPGVAWASLITNFNKTESKVLVGATGMATQTMDTE